MRRLKSLIFMLLCILLIGCNKDNFYEKYNILEKQELTIEETNSKSGDVETIIENINYVSGEDFVCNVFKERYFVKSYVPITQRSYNTFIYDNGKFNENYTIHFFSNEYEYFEENVASSYIETTSDKTIYYLDTKNRFEDETAENKTKSEVDESYDLIDMFPLYDMILSLELESGNKITQQNDCVINGTSYYHLVCATKNYDDFVLGEESSKYVFNDTKYDFYINKDTNVVDYIVLNIQDEKNDENNVYCFIEYVKEDRKIVIPEDLLELPLTIDNEETSQE